ncbi:MAG: ATP-binding cassette domain-containing protein [Bacteroidetes bacterium]|nr:MAG: ATP-binding cassette domain-containing protein [Bacteroidota bacterium]
MSETVLDALVKLFALIGDIHDETVITSREKDIVRTFLARHLNQELVARYMKMFEEYLTLYNSESIKKGTVEDRKRISLNAMRILAICEKINEELQQKQKIYILVQLIEYISLGEEITENELDFLHTVASAFYIPDAEFHDIKNFIMSHVSDVMEKSRVLVVDNKMAPGQNDIKHLFDENLKGNILFLNISSTNSFIVRYSGNEDLYLNGQIIFPEQIYMFDHGSSIRGSGIKTVYYSEVASQISEASYDFKICLDANDVSFKFRNSENGIHNLNFHEESGKLVGIIGGSGVGKSTTLSILNGTLKPHSGEVLINGYNLYDDNEKTHLLGVIGYVPQDDLLIEELTVFQNIWFNARMCLNNLTENEIVEVVNKTLHDFDLNEIRDLKVGNPLKKIISGGQRKRVNIALELLRQPTILFVDEPTSGLSSVDSEIVMNLLKDQTYKGKLVIVNIHQPNSEIYKMFDNIMIIDKGGYQVYYGNPTEAIIYFKTITNHANKDEDQCVKCGNVDTDQILQIIEAKVIDEQGKATRIRKVTPEEWAEKFRKNNISVTGISDRGKVSLPENIYSIPGLVKQSKIFFTRDFLSKISDKQYILISLLGPSLLALILAYFTKSANGETYTFSENENIPAYLFVSIISSLFFGLMISSEEIVKDRKILKRESFLNLSWFSYLNSKVMIMFILSAIQTLSFVLIGNLILEIKGMTLSYWLVLFTTSCIANILGLNISSAFNSVITIYTLIPLIIIPQLLFSGVFVKFDKLHLTGFSSHEYVPLIGDVMPARWSFEALAVDQFKNNAYEKHFFKYDLDESQNFYYASFLIVNLKNDLAICSKYLDSSDYRDIVRIKLRRINIYIDQLSALAKISPGKWESDLNVTNFNVRAEKESILFLDSLGRCFMSFSKYATRRNNAISDSLKKAIGKGEVVALRDNYENKKLKFIVLDQEPGEKTYDQNYKIIQKFNPGYMKATSKFGRAHFYAPVKKLGNLEIDTYWFNIIVIWMVTLVLYIALYFNLLQKTIKYFGNLRFSESD